MRMRQLSLCVLIVTSLAGATQDARAQPISSAFTYNGVLSSGGAPALGLFDMRFRLYDAASGGVQVGAELCSNDVALADGRFVVTLDFGAQFNGSRRWLEIDVRANTGSTCADLAGYSRLAPRQELTATPYAARSIDANNAAQLNGQPASFYSSATNLTSGSLPNARLSGSYTSVVNLSNASNTLAGSGAGLTSLNASNLGSGTIPSARFSGSYTSAVNLSNTSNVFAGSGALLTGVNAAQFSGQDAAFYQNASNLASGTLPDARLASNVPRLDAVNAFGNFTNSFGGNVGIRTTSPVGDLHIRGATTTGRLVLTPSAADSVSEFWLMENNTASIGVVARYDGTGANQFMLLPMTSGGVIGAPLITVNRTGGDVSLSGSLSVGGSITFGGTTRHTSGSGLNFTLRPGCWNGAERVRPCDSRVGSLPIYAPLTLPDGVFIRRIHGYFLDCSGEASMTLRLKASAVDARTTIALGECTSDLGEANEATQVVEERTFLPLVSVDNTAYAYYLELAFTTTADLDTFEFIGYTIDYELSTIP